MTEPDSDQLAIEASTTAVNTGATEAGFTVSYSPQGAPRQRRRYVSRDGGAGWWRVHEEWTGCVWRTIGREPIADIVVEGFVPAGGETDA